jgi:type II secretory pathway pseudopilin PulG
MLIHRTPKKNQRLGFTLGEVLIAFLIFGLLTGGLMYGYVAANRMAEMSSMSLAAQSFALQGLEEAKSVQWNYVRWPSTNADSTDPFWTPSTVGFTNLAPQVDTLDVPTTGNPIYVTNYVTVTDINSSYYVNSNSPIRQIVCNCVWAFPLDGTLCTNTAVCLRSPDQ